MEMKNIDYDSITDLINTYPVRFMEEIYGLDDSISSRNIIVERFNDNVFLNQNNVKNACSDALNDSDGDLFYLAESRWIHPLELYVSLRGGE